MKTAEKTNGVVQGANQKKEEVNKVTTLRPNEPLKPQEKPNPEAKTESETKEAKPVPNLEQTLKVVENLHRRSIQRINLLSRIQQLDAFEIALLENGDELENNHFQGCQLIISDDKGRKFITQTSGLITLVAGFIRSACMEKLAEIEANIVFPKS